MRGSYRPYVGRDFMDLVDRVERDGAAGSSPSPELEGMINAFDPVESCPSEILIRAHAEGVSLEAVTGMMRERGHMAEDQTFLDFDDESVIPAEAPPPETPSAEQENFDVGSFVRGDEMHDMLMDLSAQGMSRDEAMSTVQSTLDRMGVYGNLDENDRKQIGDQLSEAMGADDLAWSDANRPAESAEQDPVEQKAEALEGAKEATTELAEGKAELAAEKAKLAGEHGDEEAAEDAKQAAVEAAEKGGSALKGKAATAAKMAVGGAAATALSNLETMTGGKRDISVQSPPVQGGGSKTQPVAATDTAEDMKKRAEAAQSKERPTTNLGNWGGR